MNGYGSNERCHCDGFNVHLVLLVFQWDIGCWNNPLTVLLHLMNGTFVLSFWFMWGEKDTLIHRPKQRLNHNFILFFLMFDVWANVNLLSNQLKVALERCLLKFYHWDQGYIHTTAPEAQFQFVLPSSNFLTASFHLVFWCGKYLKSGFRQIIPETTCMSKQVFHFWDGSKQNDTELYKLFKAYISHVHLSKSSELCHVCLEVWM